MVLCILMFKFIREITTSKFIDVKTRSSAFSYFLRRYVKFTMNLTSTCRCTLRVTHRFEKPLLDTKCFRLQTTECEYILSLESPLFPFSYHNLDVLQPFVFTIIFYFRFTLCVWTYSNILRRKGKGKGKAVPLQAWSGPEGSRKLRFPDFMTTAQEGGKVVSLTHWPHLPPGNSPGTHFC